MKKLFMPPNSIFCSQLLHIFALIKNKIEIINLMRSLCLNNLTWCVLWWKYIIRNVNILLESWKTKMKTKTRGSFTELPDGRLETLVILFYSRLAVPWTGQTSERVKEKHPIFVVCHNACHMIVDRSWATWDVLTLLWHLLVWVPSRLPKAP